MPHLIPGPTLFRAQPMADLGWSLVAFCGIWDALGPAGQPKVAILDSSAGGSTDFKARGRWRELGV